MRADYRLSITILVMIVGCSGTTTPPPSETPPPAVAPPPGFNPGLMEGFWSGEIVSNVSGDSHELVGLIDGWGTLVLASEQGQYVGNLNNNSSQNSPTDFEVSLTGITAVGFRWPDDSTQGSFAFDGSVSVWTDISGNYSGAGDNGTFLLTFDPASNRGSDIQRVLGMWMLRDMSQNITATLQVDVTSSWTASINGSNADGCVYTGEVSGDAWLSVFVFPVDLTVANCPIIDGIDLNGNYYGTGAVTDIEAGSNQDDKFIVAVNSDTQVITLALEKIQD